LSHWETTSRLKAGLDPALVWRRAYLDAGAWPSWNAETVRSLPSAQRAIVALAGTADQPED
jgi:hypothetical protein